MEFCWQKVAQELDSMEKIWRNHCFLRVWGSRCSFSGRYKGFPIGKRNTKSVTKRWGSWESYATSAKHHGLKLIKLLWLVLFRKSCKTFLKQSGRLWIYSPPRMPVANKVYLQRFLFQKCTKDLNFKIKKRCSFWPKKSAHAPVRRRNFFVEIHQVFKTCWRHPGGN